MTTESQRSNVNKGLENVSGHGNTDNVKGVPANGLTGGKSKNRNTSNTHVGEHTTEEDLVLNEDLNSTNDI